MVGPTSSKPSPKNSEPVPDTTSSGWGLVSAQVGGPSLLTTTLNVCVAFGATPFAATTVTGNVPTADGVQLITPVDAPIAIPLGAEVNEKVGAGRPVAATVYVYAALITAVA